MMAATLLVFVVIVGVNGLQVIDVSLNTWVDETGCSHGITLPAVNNAASLPRICKYGKAVPQVYMLGAQKAGSTTLAFDLTQAGLRSAIPSKRKELHVLDELCGFQHPNNWTVSHLRGESLAGECTPLGEHDANEWAGHFETCASDGPALADGSPINLRLPGLPATLAALYGAAMSRLRFIVALRSPVQRMHSGYYQIMETGSNQLQLMAWSRSFSAYVEYLRRRLPDCDSQVHCHLGLDYTLDIAYRSMYARNLRPWLSRFEASQFAIIPMKTYFQRLDKRQEWIQQISDKFDIGLDAAAIDGASCLKQRAHPTIEEDLTPNASAWLHDYFNKELDHLSKLLKDSIPKGLALMGYNGDEQLRHYLRHNW